MRPLALALLLLPVQAAAQAVGFGAGLDRAAPVEVAADSLEVDGSTGRAVLTGDVVIAQGPLRLTAATVEIAYAGEGDARRIDRVIARGDVLLVTDGAAAEAAEAVYDLGRGEVVLTGDVLVTQDGATLAGERLSVNLDTGAGTVTGRVRTTLRP